jgi:hypothetical protein
MPLAMIAATAVAAIGEMRRRVRSRFERHCDREHADPGSGGEKMKRVHCDAESCRRAECGMPC